MAGLQRRTAQRKKAKLRLGISGPAGSGKTYSSLLMAYGITKDWTKITLIDTENFSGDLYADLGEYNVITLEKPYTPARYIEAIEMCIAAGDEAVIIDSLTHAWSGEGGLLDQQGKIADKSGNSWTAWRTVTPQHNKLVDTILTAPIHIITTVRSKMEYVQEKDPSSGKVVIRKVGMGSICKDGMEYEFTIYLELNQDHSCQATKDRTKLFDINYWFTPSEKTGEQLREWLEAGVEVEQPASPVAQPIEREKKSQKTESTNKDELVNIITQVETLAKEKITLVGKDKTVEIIKQFAVDNKGNPTANYNVIKDANLAKQLLEALKNLNVEVSE
jgi:hypothetical protein